MKFRGGSLTGKVFELPMTRDDISPAESLSRTHGILPLRLLDHN